MISAFGVEHGDQISKTVGAKTFKPFRTLWDKAKFGNAPTMFGSRSHTENFRTPKKKAKYDENGKEIRPASGGKKIKWEKGGKEMPSAFEVGMHRGYREGYGPMRSAAEGLRYAAAHSPGTAVVAGTGAVGALGGGAYVAGRSMKREKSDG